MTPHSPQKPPQAPKTHWLARLLASLLGLGLCYLPLLYSQEGAFLLSLLAGAMMHRHAGGMVRRLSLDQVLAGAICASLIGLDSPLNFALKALASSVLIRLYDCLRPSLIGRLYFMGSPLGHLLGGALTGVLSGLSILLLWKALFFVY